MTFERHVAIDWSGAGKSSARTRGLAVADDDGIVSPPRYTTWSRNEIDEYLASVLRPDQARTIVAIDAALSFPYGFQSAVFGVRRWDQMVEEFGALAEQFAMAREIARSVNKEAAGGGPFRFNSCRNDNSFYRECDVGYFRAVELFMPQCISPFYLGSGATVGFHAITCLGSIARLMTLRAGGEVAFHVWPQEGLQPPRDAHVIAECYPALYPDTSNEALNRHEKDAWRTVQWLKASDVKSEFQIKTVHHGRRSDVSWDEQLRFEGWVLGV